MTTPLPSPLRSLVHQRHAVVWLGVLTLLLSLLTPIVSIQSADAAQTRTSQEACDPGFVLNEESGECEPFRPGNLQIAQECEDGTVRSQDTGECEPEAPGGLQQAPPVCREGEELHRETGECIPISTDDPPLVQECPEGTTLNQQTGQCEADSPQAESTDVPMLNEPPQEAGNTVTVKKYQCPLGAPYDELGFEVNDICTNLHDGVDFTIAWNGFSNTQTTGGSGEASWNGVPSGPITIQETIPDGFGDPYVFCRYVDDAQGGLALVSAHIPLDNGLLEWEMTDGPLHLECRWYNIPDDPDGGSITIQKWNCPPGYDVGQGADPLAVCTETAGGVTFTIDDGNAPAPDHVEVTGDDQGAVVFTGLEPGTHTVTEEVPPGTAYAAGWCHALNGGPLHLDNPPRLVFEIGEVAHWECDWLNVPDVDSSVTVRKFNCPNGVFGESLLAHEAGCTDVGNGIEFTLDNSDGSSTKAIAGGSAVWNDVPQGPFTITETIPPGWSEPNWFCGENYIDPETGHVVIGLLGPINAPDGVLSASIGQATTEYFCKVYNLPGGGTNSLTAHKWLCPEGFDENIDAPETHCTEAMAGVTFSLDGMEATSGDAGPGTAVFPDVPAGDYEHTEILPPGIERAFVECDANPNPPGLMGVLLTEPPIAFIVFPDEVATQWVCNWYNVPEEDEENSVTIRKWICPEGTSYEESQGWYEANCIQQHDGVEFTVTSDLGIAVKETAGGAAHFDGLPAGVVGIQETIPAGYGEPIVFCTDDGAWSPYPAPTGHWQHEFPHDGTSESFVCYVFNIPGERPDVTIYKWTCPEGYDLNAAGADPKTDCTEATNGVEFQFGPSAPAAVAELQTTGDVIDGGVVFDDLEPGTYKAVELVPDGIDHVFVLECTGHIMGVLQPYPLQMGNILDNIDVDAGEHLTCHWYNVPERDGEKLTLIKYICTTEVFVDEVDCETFEHGQTFDLLHWNTDDGVWEVIDTEVTDGVGMIVWTDLAPGDYGLDELDGDWCHLSTTPVFGPGDFFSIFEGEATVVKVYNCDPDWTTTTIPQKYPNTGMPQGALLQIDPTAEPGTQLQAAPTSTPSMPIRVAPTETPTPRVTEEPGSPGGLQANPTEVPPEDPDSDLPLQAEPTQVPAVELPDDAGQLEIGATVYVTATVCDGVGFDPYTSTYWWGFIAGCPYPPNGWPVLDFEFTATDGAGFLETSSAEWPDDVVEFNVPAATVTVSTSIPDGFAEPVSLCIETGLGYSPVLNEPPPGVLLHTVGDSLTLDLAPGQGYSCAFYHVTEVPHSNAVTVHAWLCPQATAQGMPLTDYLDACSDGHSDLGLTLYPFTGGPQATTTVEGMAHWDSVSMGQIILVMESPSGFDEPVVICGTTESPGGGIQHPALVPPDVQGNYRGVLEVPGAELVCHWFSMPE